MDILVTTGSGSFENKEPVEPELQQMRGNDCQSESQQLVKTEAEGISLDDNQDLPKQETDIIMVTVSGCLEIKEEPLELELEQRKEDDCLSQSQRLVKIEAEGISLDDNQDLPKHEFGSIILNVSGSLEIKEEPVELELHLMKEDGCQLGCKQMVKAEAEIINQDGNQEVLKQEISTVMVADSGSLQVKGEPGDRDPEHLKEEDEGSGPQQMGNISQEVVKQENDTLTASGDESEYQEPELNGEKILYQNIAKTEQPQDIKAEKASGSIRKEQQQKRVQKSRGQCDDEEKMIKDNNIDKVKICQKCSVCGRNFKHNEHLIVHMRTHTGEKPFSCITCRRSFNCKNNLNIHIRTHTGQKPFSCIICRKSLCSSKGLKIHMRTHTVEKPFSCITCGTGFKWKSSLYIHMRSHTGENPFTCITCRKVFTKKYSLYIHMRTHTGEKPFLCITCGKSFSRRNSLNRHMRTHTVEKPFSCIDCGKDFKWRSGLSYHMRTHAAQQPFMCVTCGKGFTEKSDFNIHMKRHTDDSPFSCLTCGKTFSRKHSLKRHMRTHI